MNKIKSKNRSEWKLWRGCSGREEIGPKWVRIKGKTKKTTWLQGAPDANNGPNLHLSRVRGKTLIVSERNISKFLFSFMCGVLRSISVVRWYGILQILSSHFRYGVLYKMPGATGRLNHHPSPFLFSFENIRKLFNLYSIYCRTLPFL